MISPIEIRFNNLIEYQGRTVTVLEIRRDDFLVLDMGLEMVLHYGSEDVKGIEISSRWLKKNGFEYLESNWEPDEYVLREPGSIERLFTLKNWRESFFYIEQGDVVKYVHTLQNLFYDLKNQELTIKHLPEF